MNLKEIVVMAIATTFMNWFLLKILNMHGSIIKPTEVTWIVGFFTGVISAKLLIELFKHLEK